MTVTTARPTGAPGYSETLPSRPQSVATARRLVRTALATWRLEELSEGATLVVSELVTNAVQHSSSRSIRVTVSRAGPASVRVGVVDKSKGRPVLGAPPSRSWGSKADDDDESGRGLVLVEALAHSWGTDPLPWGKRVWAELTAS